MLSIFRKISSFLLVLIVSCESSDKPVVTFLKLYSAQGDYSLYTDVIPITQKWQEHLTSKFLYDDSWPFDGRIELLNVNSSIDLCQTLLEARLLDALLPNVTVIIGPEAMLGLLSAPISAKYGIPIVLTTSDPKFPDQGHPPSAYDTAFFMESPTMYIYRSMIDEYVRVGVKSMVSVAVLQEGDEYNAKSCFGAADYLATPRGIKILAKFSYNLTATSEDIRDIVRQIKVLNPDAVHWCDWQSCLEPDRFDVTFALKKFKELDYLPKAFTALDCFDYELSVPLLREGYFDFTGAGSYFHKDLKGSDYTQDNNPYSNIFRPEKEVHTIYDALNTGTSAASPSSSFLFYSWYTNLTGYIPYYQTVGEWAAFDLIEAAVYRASETEVFMADGVISPAEVMKMLTGSQASGPYGRVVFDANRINTFTPAHFVQLRPNSLETNIVAPSTLSTMKFIYPMPTWKERVYEWSIIKGPHTRVAVAVASVCSFVLLVMAVTVIAYRKDVTVRMVHFGHMASLCFAGIIVCMSLAMLWQADVRQFQCDCYLWTVYLPASYMVHLVNMKAYRLSCFLRCDDSPESLKRVRKLTHTVVLRKTLELTSITLAVLIVIYFVDRPRVVKVVLDEYRPALNYHYCSSGVVTKALLIIVIVEHVLISFFCILSIRNGMDAFRDGLVMKEAFIVLYALLLAEVIIAATDIEYSTVYLMRTVCLCLGVTGFCFRILISRCIKHWVPQYIWNAFTVVFILFKRQYTVIFPSVSMATSSSLKVSQIDNQDLDGDSPLYSIATPSESSIVEMLKIIKDPSRSALFRELAEKAHVVENVDFLVAVLQYVDKAEQMLVQQSVAVSKELKDDAMDLYYRFLKTDSAREVNVSHKIKQGFEAHVRNWDDTTPIINQKQVGMIYGEDTMGRCRIFDAAMKEVSIVLYQNLWNKFRAIDKMNDMAQNDQGHYSPNARRDSFKTVVQT